MLALWNQVDDLFNDELFKRHRERGGFVPPVDIREDKEGYELLVDLPGMGPDDVELTVEGGNLTITGERPMPEGLKNDEYRRIERAYGAFRRVFTLPKGANQDSIEAHVEHGMLKVRVPKPVAELPRKIKVTDRKMSIEASAE